MDHVLEVFGVLLQILLDLLLLVGTQRWSTSSAGLVIEADEALRLPAVDPRRYAAAVHLVNLGNTRNGEALVTEQETMRAYTGASGGMIAMPVM
jgi:hypothetical protein